MMRTHFLAFAISPFLAVFVAMQTAAPLPGEPGAEMATQVKDAHDFVMAVAESMPKWDADYVGRFERAEIALVKSDILICNQDTDVDDFMIDVQQLRIDDAALVALDDALQKEHVI